MTTHVLTTLSNTTATRLTPEGYHTGMDITIQNVNDEAYVYLGGSGVNTSNYGFRILPNHSWSIELPGRDPLYAISNLNGAQAAIIWTGVELM